MDYPVDRPIERPEIRPIERPEIRPIERPYDRSYDRGNGYDNLDSRYPYDERYPAPARRPTEDPYVPTRYDRYNNNINNREYGGRYDARYDRYDRYDPYERNMWRRPMFYEDRYGGRQPVPDSRGYYSGAWGPGYDRRYASGWNSNNNNNNNGGNRDNWRDLNRDRDRDRDNHHRDQDRDRDRDRDPK